MFLDGSSGFSVLEENFGIKLIHRRIKFPIMRHLFFHDYQPIPVPNTKHVCVDACRKVLILLSISETGFEFFPERNGSN